MNASLSETSAPNRAALDRYLRHGLRQVKGWVSGGTERFISELSLAQIEAGLKGSVGEIGVHQGKLFLLLLLTKRQDEGAFAIDPLENQPYNLAINQPRGVDILKGHIAQWAPDATRVEIIKAYSTAVQPDDVIEKSGRARLLSVDGAHHEDVVIKDMEWADRVLEPNGVIIVDDFFNSQYPGVCAAVCRFLLRPDCRFKPFAISPGKLYLAEAEAGLAMRAAMKQRLGRYFGRSTTMFGSELDIYRFPDTSWKAKLKKAIKRVLPI